MAIGVKAPPTTTARDSRSPVLVAMADTFIGGMGHPGSPIRVAASMEETFARLPSAADRRRMQPREGLLHRRGDSNRRTWMAHATDEGVGHSDQHRGTAVT